MIMSKIIIKEEDIMLLNREFSQLLKTIIESLTK